jgi:outer membrane protein OmpA-like peptidoglycan-associated protein
MALSGQQRSTEQGNTAMQRRAFLTAFATALAVPALPGLVLAQETPSSEIILRRLDAAPTRRLRDDERVTVREFKRRPDLRGAAPSINIQSINFAFGSADIPRSEYGKVRQIARAMEQLLRRRRRAVFLIEGHTDAVGSAASNQILSERRAESLKRLLVQEFGLPSRALETVGYGEDYLLVQTLSEEWRNRRVTLRRIDEFVR